MARAALWGRQVPEYAISYDAVALLRTPDLNFEEQISLRIDAVTSICDICRLVGNKQGSELETAASQIDSFTLQSVLNLAYSPHTFRHFANPSLISACIRLMSTVKLSGEPVVSISDRYIPLSDRMEAL